MKEYRTKFKKTQKSGGKSGGKGKFKKGKKGKVAFDASSIKGQVVSLVKQQMLNQEKKKETS